MADKIIIHKGRTNKITANLNMDITGDTITSEIRTQEDPTSDLLLTWAITVVSAATGELELEVDDAATAQVEVDSGYMDFKRVSSGEALPVLSKPLEVQFRNVVTA